MSRGPESMPLLEVTVLHPRDAAAAAHGEADRLLLLAEPEAGGRTPDPATLSAVVRETDLPVRVLLREGDSLESGPDAVRRLAERARGFQDLGAAGFAFAFLDRDLEIDRAACAALAELLGVGWSFHRGFDAALDPARAWRAVRGLPGLDAVATAGSTRGLAAGGEELVARAGRDPEVAALVLASGDLRAELVPWLVRAGVDQFALAEEARVDGSWTKAYVDAAAVRSWRLLLDDAQQRARGVAVD